MRNLQLPAPLSGIDIADGFRECPVVSLRIAGALLTLAKGMSLWMHSYVCSGCDCASVMRVDIIHTDQDTVT